MPLIGQQNPWITGAQGLDSGASDIGRILLSLPAMRQQLGLGELQQQLVRGQIAQQPFEQQLLQARTGQEAAQGGMYQSHGNLLQAQAIEQQRANDSLSQFQQLIQPVLQAATTGQRPSPEITAQLGAAYSGVGKDAKVNLMDGIMATLGMSNPKVTGNVGVQTDAVLGGRAMTTPHNIPEGATMINPLSGQPTPGMVNLAPEHQLFVPQQRVPGMAPQFGNPTFGPPSANNPNASPSASKSSALARTVLSAIMQNDPSTDPQDALKTINKLFPGEVPGLSVGGMNGAPTLIAPQQTQQGQPVKIDTEAEYKSLAPGTPFIDATGHTKIKK